MSIQNIEEAKVLKEYCNNIGREGMGDTVIKIAKEIIDLGDKGEYVEIMKKVGEIRAISTGANCDCYFSEKVRMGFTNMLYIATGFCKKGQ